MIKNVRARRVAREFLDKLEIRKVPVDIEAVVEQEAIKQIEELSDLKITIQREVFPDGLEDVSAVLLKEMGQAVITVNSLHSNVRQRFSIAHELGHLLMHSNNKHLIVDRYEKQLFTRAEGVRTPDEIEANEFAAAVLMPESRIKKDFEKFFEKEPDEIISKLAKKYSVSEIALTYRLKNLKLLS